MKPRSIAAIAALVPLAFAASATAHVEFAEPTGTAGDLALVTLQMPNEKTDSPTVSVSVQIPEGIDLVRFVPKAGWARTVKTAPLSAPAQVGDDTVNERISEVTWSGGEIKPGELETFQMSVALPAAEGATYRFPAVQRYADGETARWIGPEGSDEPAPTLTAIAEAAEEGTEPVTAVDSGGDGKTNAALGFGIAGLVAGLAGLASGFIRRRRAAVSPDA